MPTLIIMRYARSEIYNDWTMVLARFMESFVMTFAMPPNVSLVREYTQKIIYRLEYPPSVAR